MTADSPSKTCPTWRRTLGIIIILAMLAAMVALDHPFHQMAHRGLVNGTVIGLIYLSLALGLLAAFLSRNVYIRTTTALLLAATLAWHFGYQQITGERFSYDATLMLISSLDTTGQAAAVYWMIFLPIIAALLIALPLASWAVTRYLIDRKSVV